MASSDVGVSFYVDPALRFADQFPLVCPLVVFSCHRRNFLKQLAHTQYVAQIIIRRIALMHHGGLR